MSTRQARSIVCPSCGHPKETKANTGVVVACTGCGERYRVPAAGAPSPPPAGASSPGVKVARATPKTTQRARPRSAGSSTKTEAAPATVDPPAPPPRRSDADNGRRGGRARAGYGLAGFAAERLGR